MSADFLCLGMVYPVAVHIYQHNKFDPGNTGQHAEKIRHLLPGLPTRLLHALNNRRGFRRELGHIGHCLLGLLKTILADKIRSGQMTQQDGWAEGQTDHNHQLDEQAVIF